MGGKSNSKKQTGLLSLETPGLVYSQIDLFARGLIHEQPVMAFDPDWATKALEKSKNQEVIGIDIGGDKYFEDSYTVQDRSLRPKNQITRIHAPSGKGYLSQMQKTSSLAAESDTPVGLSIGLKMNGTRPDNIEEDKLIDLRNELQDKYNNDFARVLPRKHSCLHDGSAGVICSAVNAQGVFKNKIDNIIFLINGGGISGAIFTKNTIFTSESGHVPLARELQRYKDSRPCGIFGHTHKCIENAAGNKRGIEYYWQQETGVAKSAIEIEKEFTENGPNAKLALELYDHSATIMAHLAVGLAQTFEIELASKNTAVIGHGGAFKFPDYGARIKQIIEKGLDSKIQLASTPEFSSNACAEGAAIAAIVDNAGS